MDKNPMALFRTEAPEAAAGLDALIGGLCARSDGMDAKTRQLAYIAMKAASRDGAAAAAHAPMARAAGATRGEVRDAVLLSLTAAGISGVLACLGPALEAWDRAGGAA